MGTLGGNIVWLHADHGVSVFGKVSQAVTVLTVVEDRVGLVEHALHLGARQARHATARAQ